MIAYKTSLERVADAIVHCTGALASVIAALIMVSIAIVQFELSKIAILTIYSIGLIATFVASARYNMAKCPEKRAYLRRFDLSAIYIMIAGTYTPLALIGIGGALGLTLAAINWSIALLGVWLSFNRPHLKDWVSLSLYLGQAWMVVLAIHPMWTNLTPLAFGLIFGGGLIYTAGVIFHRRDDWPFNKAIWHVFVLAAAATHYTAILHVAEIV